MKLRCQRSACIVINVDPSNSEVKNYQLYTSVMTHLHSIPITYDDDPLIDLIGIDKAMLNGFFLLFGIQ